jgi:hypothetical protein
MRFRTWLEASVSSDDLLVAMQKTLEMRVDGEWEFGYPKDVTRGDSVKITGKLRNGKTPGASHFFLSAYAIKDRPLFAYDSLSGGDGLRITASLLYIDGKGGYIGLGARGREYPGDSPKSHHGQPLNSPFWLADWVNHVVSEFEGFGDGGGDDEEPEWTPSAGPARLVGA